MTAEQHGPVGDVIVVGGGPVGVTAALLLAKHGFTVRLYERSQTVYELPRAVGMDAEIQRVFQNVGLRAELEALTTPLAGAEFVDASGKRIIGHDTPRGRPYPLGHHPSVMYHQPWLEEGLRTAARQAGAELHLGVEVYSVAEQDDGVQIETSNGSDRAAWLIAADGAASPIRKSLGVAFTDQGFDQEWLVLDVSLKRPVDGLNRHAKQICDPVRPVTIVPGHADFYRWEFQLQPGESAEAMTEPARVWELLADWLTPEDAELGRAVVYRFHATVADEMKVGRIFLAGDAAHQMPPFLGQGLCTGIRDAANLAWKLDLVERGLAGAKLLDTYDSERRPHSVDMVGHAVDTGRLIDQLAGRVESGVGLDAGYGGGREFPFLHQGVLVGDHRHVGKPFPQPIVDGVLHDEHLGAGFAILVRDVAAVLESVLDWLEPIGGRVVAVPTTVLDGVIPDRGGVIVRPDRYVAAVCQDSAAMVAAAASLSQVMDTTPVA